MVRRPFWVFVAVLAAALLGAAPAFAREDPPLKPDEQAWLDRWGLSQGDRRLKDVELLRKARFAARSREMVKAARQGDPVAWFLVRSALNLRCNGGRRLSREDCYAFYVWNDKERPWKATMSPGAQRWSDFSPAEDGHNQHAADVGMLFELGIGGPRDYAAALFFYEMSTWPSGQEAEGRYRRGLMYDQGLGVKADPARAEAELRKAAILDHPGAAYLLAMRALRTGAPDYDTVGVHLRTAADGGVVDAAYRYARLLEDGRIKRKRGPELLLKYYRMAALKGHVAAIAGVGRAYANGWGVPADDALAEEWFKRAALAGSGEGAWQVAGSYSRRGDFPGGLPWLKRAAAAGYPGAQPLLAQWKSRGVRERSIGNSLLSVLEFVGDVGVELDRQRQEELAADRAQDTDYVSALYAGGYRSATDSAGGGSASSGQSAEDGGWNNVTGGTGESPAWDNVSGSSGGGGVSVGYLVIEETNPGWRERQAAAQAAYDKSVRDGKAAADQARARGDAQAAGDRAAWEKRRDAALIACHGSLEAAERATASCQ